MSEKGTEQIIDEDPEKLRGEPAPTPEQPVGKGLILMALTALGVVFGDIGTSPLYALRACFLGDHPIPVTSGNVLGVLSLVSWALIITISIKYLVYVMRADNEGEGGILALMALLSPRPKERTKGRWVVMAVGVFGAALLYGDGVITPAISVLSAVEGLKVAEPGLAHFVVPITVLILVLLFAVQRHGTAVVGSIFGPVMIIWFLTIAILGVAGITRHPQVLASILPIHGLRFFVNNQWIGFLILGAVFLVVTGGEALYADMGHFNARTIRFAWFAVVLPSLLLNYFGQGALLLSNPKEVIHPFFHLSPDWATFPLVILATLATIIASQAIISGVFSLSRQAAFLGLFPRLRILQTSAKQIGQIYIPSMNWLLMIGTVVLVLAFRNSGGLAGAYGVAVSTTMVITTFLTYKVAREHWQWGLPAAILVTMGFLLVDLAFFVANMFRVVQGGWIPLLVGAIIFGVMNTWTRGRNLVRHRLEVGAVPLESFVKVIEQDPPLRVPGTAVIMAGNPQQTPPFLLRQLNLIPVMHERVILLTVMIDDVPRVARRRRMKINVYNQGVSQVLLRFGFMEEPNVPEILEQSRHLGPDIDRTSLTYYLGTYTLIPARNQPGMAMWRKRLYAFMASNTAQPIAVFGLPYDRVIELGIRVEF
jgi:KUP system potassium uptake protein